MSADWYDGMDGEFKVETREFILTKNSRIYFDAAQFPDLVCRPSDEKGTIEFSGKISFDIDGYAMRDVINGVIVSGDDTVTILEGGLSGAVLWKQGRTREYSVQGFIVGFGDGCFVIYPETIDGE